MQRTKEKLWTKAYITALFIMLGVQVINELLFSTIAVYGKGLTGSDVFAGTLATAFTIAAFASRFAAGVMFRKFSLKIVMLIGVGCTTAAAFGYLLADSGAILILLRMVQGFGFGIAGTAAITAVTNSLAPSRMLEGIGYSGITSSVALAIAPALALSLCGSDWMLFDKVFMVHIVVNLVVLVIACFVKINSAPPEKVKIIVVNETIGEDDANRKKEKDHSKLFVFAVILFVVLSFIANMLQSSVSALISVYAVERVLGNISLFFTIYAATSLIGRLIMPKIVEELGERMTLLGCFAVLGLSLLGIAASNSAAILFVIAIPYGLLTGIVHPIFNAGIINEVDYAEQGTANALYYASCDIGIGFGAFAWSAVGQSMGYTMAYVFAGFIAFITLAAYFMVSRNQKK